MSDFLEVKNLTVEYTSGGQIVQAVNDVSFTLKKKESLGLVGETGAGKTTIAKAILQILPDPPARIRQGEIFLEGKNCLSSHKKELLSIRGSKISMIFQDPMTALNPIMSVGSQITEVIRLHNKISDREAVERACSMLEMVGIPRVRYVEYPHQFSGGMKQRVVIAMALACEPELLLADEPTTALDVTVQAQVLDLMKELREKMETTMILITHDLGVVAETCDKVAIVYAGRIMEYGTKEDIFIHPCHPYTHGLFDSIPRMEKTSNRLKSIPGMPPDPTNLPQGCPFAPRCERACGQCRQGEIPATEVSPGHFVRCREMIREEK